MLIQRSSYNVEREGPCLETFVSTVEGAFEKLCVLLLEGLEDSNHGLLADAGAQCRRQPLPPT